MNYVLDRVCAHLRLEDVQNDIEVCKGRLANLPVVDVDGKEPHGYLGILADGLVDQLLRSVAFVTNVLGQILDHLHS